MLPHHHFSLHFAFKNMKIFREKCQKGSTESNKVAKYLFIFGIVSRYGPRNASEEEKLNKIHSFGRRLNKRM